VRLGFPIFSSGAYAQDQRLRGRVIDYRCPLEFANGCRVNDGNRIVGDVDGVVIVPGEAVGDIVKAAIEKARAERDVAEMIASGGTTADIFEATGVMQPWPR
jgi:regulator of RNase E activity RraA